MSLSKWSTNSKNDSQLGLGIFFFRGKEGGMFSEESGCGMRESAGRILSSLLIAHLSCQLSKHKKTFVKNK